MGARIAAVDYLLPEGLVSNETLQELHPDWKVSRISATTGVESRHVAEPGEFASDLATAAAKKLFASHNIASDSIDYLIVCTQTPDFYLPTTACIVHENLGLNDEAGAVDVTLGCSGFVYSLGLAKGLVESNQAQKVLIITVDVLSLLSNQNDKSTVPIFGDGAAATLVEVEPGASKLNGFVYGTDGTGAKDLLVPNGGLRNGGLFSPKSDPTERGLESTGHDLYMDGKEIFNFTLRITEQSVMDILDRAGMDMAEVDYFVFHQANGFILKHLQKKLNIPDEKFVMAIEHCGNTSSSSIPIGIAESGAQPGDSILVLGFGVGFSWAGAVVTL
ncbi:ketoacyl-ACP synthase III [Lysinibacter cavernae]|uniref:3-oxoacyl-[acyl-carrier-protein] synthase-3 n=1 Tax=Lysinibacter cavernae TaxID=1640652 RepID=A0A7X5R2C9_9MICO|nr:ketoacyl-ACP synthase III [Lysinibacter cavernae]NIH54110.1 3-oxoacyl-[acyl-carrier-protein] synthase-3 [Lysinibacter cavernae]